jgi:hypothetical protein
MSTTLASRRKARFSGERLTGGRQLRRVCYIDVLRQHRLSAAGKSNARSKLCHH